MITPIITTILAITTIIGTARWNKDRFSLWRLSVTALSLLYSTFAVMYFVRDAGYLPVREEVANGYNSIKYATELIGKWMPSLSSDIVRIAMQTAIVIIDVLVAIISAGLGFNIFPKVKFTTGKYIGLGLAIIMSIPFLFPLCCLIMSAGGYAFNLTYKEFCVIGNNYGQAAALVWSAFAVMICVIRYQVIPNWRDVKKWLLLLASIIYCGCYIWAFVFMWNHYNMPLEQAFDLTVKELTVAGKYTHLGYNGINLAIYVFGFIAIIAFNCSLASQTKKNTMNIFIKTVLWLIIIVVIAGLWICFYSYSNPHNYKTIGDIPTPMGYERIKNVDTAFAGYLRSLPLKERGSYVQLYTGGKASFQQLCYAVIDMPLLSNAEQCADVCMRLRAEYLYNSGKYSKIHFKDVNGNTMNYVGGDSRKAFESYMKRVYGVASTFSLSRELPCRKLKDIQVGDVFVYAARPGKKYGHAVMVVDVAKNSDGKTVFMLAEGNTPARDMHLLSNWQNPFRSPWFTLDEDAEWMMLSPFYYNADELHCWE